MSVEKRLFGEDVDSALFRCQLDRGFSLLGQLLRDRLSLFLGFFKGGTANPAKACITRVHVKRVIDLVDELWRLTRQLRLGGINNTARNGAAPDWQTHRTEFHKINWRLALQLIITGPKSFFTTTGLNFFGNGS